MFIVIINNHVYPQKAQRLPTASYPLFKAIQSEITGTGKLSDLQLEGVLFAVSIVNRINQVDGQF